MTSLIVAVSDNGVIGKNNDLPWYLPDDLKHFRNTTRGCPVIMGRKNFESIEQRLKGPLPGRLNIVVTRQKAWKYESVEVVGSLEEAISIAKTKNQKPKTNNLEEVFIIGGGQIYKEALEKNLIEKMYITYVHANIEGDVFFPEFDAKKWNEAQRHEHASDENHEYSFSIVTLERK